VDDRSLGGACARKELCAHIVIDGEADFGTISSAYGLPGYDVAALIVKSRLIKPGMPALAINSDFILPGTSVIAVGLPRAGVRSVRQLGAGSRAIVYEHALEARAGKIRAVPRGSSGRSNRARRV
jgi:hypothetical protein